MTGTLLTAPIPPMALSGPDGHDEHRAVTDAVAAAMHRPQRHAPVRPEDRGLQEYLAGTFFNAARQTEHPYWHIPSAFTRDRVFVLIHGWGSGKASSSGHSVIDAAPYFHQFGDVFLFDQAGHGEASGMYTFGYLEQHDVRSAVACASALGHYQEVILVGFCGGCVAVALALPTLPQPVRAILDSPTVPAMLFTNPLLHQKVFRMPVEQAPITRRIVAAAVGVNLATWTYPQSYPDAANRDNTFVVLGGRDPYLDAPLQQTLRAHWSPDDIGEIPDAGHVRGLMTHPDQWETLVRHRWPDMLSPLAGGS